MLQSIKKAGSPLHPDNPAFLGLPPSPWGEFGIWATDSTFSAILIRPHRQLVKFFFNIFIIFYMIIFKAPHPDVREAI